MSKLDKIIQQVRAELGPEFIATDIVGTDGISIAGASFRSDFDNASAAARLSMVMKLASKTSQKLGFGDVIDELVTTDKTYIIARLLGDGSYFWEMAVSRDVTLGMVRMVMNEFAPQIWDAIPH